MDKSRVYQTYLAERAKKERGAYARTGALYGKSDEWARKLIKEYESGEMYSSVIRVFKPDELRYEPAPLELAYQKERDLAAKSLRECQQTDLLCQLLDENANCENSAVQSGSWQSDANTPIVYCQPIERKSVHCCAPAENAKWYACPDCFGPGLGWSVLTMWSTSLLQFGFVTACYRYPVLCFVLVVPVGCWMALALILTGAWLDTIFIAWRLWFSIFAVIMFLIVAIGVGL